MTTHLGARKLASTTRIAAAQKADMARFVALAALMPLGVASAQTCRLKAATTTACVISDFVDGLAGLQHAIEQTNRDTLRTLSRLARELTAQRAAALAAKARCDRYHDSPDTLAARIASYGDSLFKYVATARDSAVAALRRFDDSPRGLATERSVRAMLARLVSEVTSEMASAGVDRRLPSAAAHRLTPEERLAIVRAIDATFDRPNVRPSIWQYGAKELERRLSAP